MLYKASNLQASIVQESKDQILINNVSISLAENEFIGLIGTSGSGKSQLAYSLARINTFYGIRVDAEEQIFQLDGEKLDLKQDEDLQKFRVKYIGYILQESAAHFNPVKKIKTLFKKDSKELTGLFRQLSLDEMDRILESYPHQLSGGQLQRIAIIKCILKKPKIIIADETDASLDQVNAELVMKALVEHKKTDHYTLIWITHQQQKAKLLCDRILYMDNGALVYDGRSESFIVPDLKYPMFESNQSEETILHLKAVSKSYDHSYSSNSKSGNTILNQVDLKIHKNEIVGILGASGSGKSTLGKILAQLEIPDEGQLFIEGKLVKHAAPNRQVIYMFQDAYSSLNPQHTIADILQEALTIAPSGFTPSEMLSWVKLDETLLSKKLTALSGGMKQRIALLRALAIKPAVLILDESLNALDHFLQMEVLDLLKKYRTKHAIAMIFISHQEAMINSICETIYNLEAGLLKRIK